MPRLTTEQFVRKAKEKHGDKYDYSKSVYVACRIKVIIICPIHKEFLQCPEDHTSKKGRGCSKCANDRTRIRLRSNTPTFIKKAKAIHGDRYNYSEVVYKAAKIKITIICSIHGPFTQQPSNHLCGWGCSKCGDDSSSQKQRDSTAKLKYTVIDMIIQK